MGIFDYINFEMDCPKCGMTVRGFQSKDSYCEMATIEPDSVDNFYSKCSCGAWIEFSRKRHVDPRDKPRTVDEVRALGFVMVSPEDEREQVWREEHQ